MNKPLLLLLSIFLVYQINAQNQNIANEDCPPVPYVIGEIIDNEFVKYTWDIPCDTCDVIKYRVAEVDQYWPCQGDQPYEDGTFTPIGATQNTSWQFTLGGTSSWFGALAIRAEYDSCVADWKVSNTVFYNTYYFDTTFSLTVNISLEGGGNPEGAEITIDGANCYYEGLIYNEQVDADGIGYFEEIEFGTYDIIVSKAGYHTAVVEDFYLWQNDTVDVELKIYYVDIEEEKELNNITIFPNPANNQINIQSEELIVECQFINHLGQVVLLNETNDKQLQINTSALDEGIYIIQLKTKKTIINKKLIIK